MDDEDFKAGWQAWYMRTPYIMDASPDWRDGYWQAAIDEAPMNEEI